MQTLGFHYRITDIQAALGYSQMHKLDKFMRKRRAIALRYDKMISKMGYISAFQANTRLNSANHLYPIKIDFGKFKNSIGYGNSMEIEELSTQLTYSHPFNNIALSHFWRWDFPSEVGPYKNLNKIYRSVFETVNITELDSSGKFPLKKKYFNTIEINSKYKTKIGRKDLYVFYLGTFNSTQNKVSALVNFTEISLLRTYDHQLEMYLKLSPMLVWNNYVSYERVIANYSTQVDVVSKRPKNQTGYSIASGFDIQMSKNVGLYLRQRWMKFEDASFAKDKYKGWETTIELKAFF